MKIGVIFDMDGVLVETEEFYFERRMNFFKERGLTPGSTDLLDYVGKTDQNIWRMLVPDDEAQRETLRAAYLSYRESHPIDYRKALRPGTCAVLAQLQAASIPIGLASSSARSEIQRMLRSNDLEAAFDYVISGEELAESKPNPEIYLKAIKALGCDQSIAVEDSPLGIKAGKASGAYTVALAQRFPLDQREADVIIDNLEELLTVPFLQSKLQTNQK